MPSFVAFCCLLLVQIASFLIMAFRTLVKIPFRILFYLLVITLPFNFQAYIAGVLFAKYHNDSVTEGIKLHLQELDSWSWMDQFSVPGAPTIWEHQNNVSPFFVPQLRSNTWRDTLGVTVPYEHQENFIDDAPIDSLVSFNAAVRDLTGLCSARPTEFWVYISRLSMPSVFEWDQAFVELLEYHEMHPLPANATFANVDCAATPFLCHIWQVYYPALMHFKISEEVALDDEIDPEAFLTPLDQLRPLETRIFDLGLQLDVSPLPPGTFPTRFEQMKALTSNQGAYTIAEDEYGDYNGFKRKYDRFNEWYYFPACNRKGSFLDYSSEFDNFLLKRIARPIGLEDTMTFFNGLGFTASMLLGTVFYAVKNPLSDFWSSFFGTRTEIDELAQRLEEREAVRQRGGVFGDAAWNFADWVEDLVLNSETESAEQPAVTTQKDEMKGLFAGLRANMSSILKVA